MDVRNIALTVSYDGSNYHGWQCQPRLATVQGVLSAAIERIVDHKIKLIGAARTDAGVHAMGQAVNFHTEKGIALDGLMRGLNGLLPPDIRITSVSAVAEDFHARYSARKKSYVYCILNRSVNSPFQGRYVWHYPYKLDVSLMHRTAKTLLGEHDFSAFKKKEEIYKSTVREVTMAGVRRRGAMVYIVFEATGFLRYMVRNLVGTLVLVGSGKLGVEDFRAILASRDRVNAGPTAPPQGLFLRRVRY